MRKLLLIRYQTHVEGDVLMMACSSLVSLCLRWHAAFLDTPLLTIVLKCSVVVTLPFFFLITIFLIMMGTNSTTLGIVAFTLVATLADGFVNQLLSGSSPMVVSVSPAPFHANSIQPSTTFKRLQMVSFPEDSMSSSSSSSSSNYEKQSRQNNSPIEEDEQPPSSLSSSASSSDFTSDQYERNDGAFPLPDDMSVPKTRQLRWEREKLVLSKFANGDELFDLRHEVASLRKELAETRKLMDGASKKKGDDAVALRGLKRRVKEIEDKILRVSGRDAEFAYAVLLERVEKAESEGDKEKAKKIRKEAEEARACIPQLNMHGLWVGK